MSSKSKKKGEKILLLPGADGWEAWRGANGAGLSLAVRTEAQRPLDVDGLPGGELAMAFPIRDVASLPFRAPTTDEALFSDMADMACFFSCCWGIQQCLQHLSWSSPS